MVVVFDASQEVSEVSGEDKTWTWVGSTDPAPPPPPPLCTGYWVISMCITYLTNLTVPYGMLNRNTVYRRYFNGIMFDFAYCLLYKTSQCFVCPFLTVFIILG